MPINLQLKSLIVLHFGTQRECSMSLHIPENLLSYYVHGHKPPTPEHRKRLARALHTTERRLFGDEEGVSA